MFVEERLEKILKIITEQKKVEVTKLSELFNVSKDLIRKDLTKLEEAGLLKKTYGGAISLRNKPKDINILSRIPKDLDLKISIAQKALKQINKFEIIFLDISSINYVLAQEILKKDLEITVVTNMTDIMHLFSENTNSKTKLIGIGGIFNKVIGGFIGISTIEHIKQFNIDRCFIGTDGINISNGSITTYEQEDGLTKNEILKSSKVKNLITEKYKLKQDGAFIFSNLLQFDNLITEDLSKSLIKELKIYNLNIF